jgi:hypothetical protein
MYETFRLQAQEGTSTIVFILPQLEAATKGKGGISY